MIYYEYLPQKRLRYIVIHGILERLDSGLVFSVFLTELRVCRIRGLAWLQLKWCSLREPKIGLCLKLGSRVSESKTRVQGLGFSECRHSFLYVTGPMHGGVGIFVITHVVYMYVLYFLTFCQLPITCTHCTKSITGKNFLSFASWDKNFGSQT